MRARAESLAARHRIEIEVTRGGAINIWPPKSLPGSADPFHGHHSASGWGEALAMIRTYAEQSGGQGR